MLQENLQDSVVWFNVIRNGRSCGSCYTTVCRNFSVKFWIVKTEWGLGGIKISTIHEYIRIYKCNTYRLQVMSLKTICQIIQVYVLNNRGKIFLSSISSLVNLMERAPVSNDDKFLIQVNSFWYEICNLPYREKPWIYTLERWLFHSLLRNLIFTGLLRNIILENLQVTLMKVKTWFTSSVWKGRRNVIYIDFRDL